eukprot:gene11627-11771_t
MAVRAIGSDRPGSSGGYGGRYPGSGSSGGASGPRRSKPERKARTPGLFEIKVVTPPPRSLGIYALPPNTHNGEQIEIDGQGYVVTSLVLKYKLVKGKYVRDHSRLEVLPTSRYFLNMMLDGLVHAKYIGPTGQQD